MQTFRKLPNTSPNRKTAVAGRGSIRLQEWIDYGSGRRKVASVECGYGL
jgi:hypothetical protein